MHSNFRKRDTKSVPKKAQQAIYTGQVRHAIENVAVQQLSTTVVILAVVAQGLTLVLPSEHPIPSEWSRRVMEPPV